MRSRVGVASPVEILAAAWHRRARPRARMPRGVLVAAGSVAALLAVAACGEQTTGDTEGAAGEVPVGCGLPDGILGVFQARPEPPPGGEDEPGADVWSLGADGAVGNVTGDRRSFDPSMSADGERIYFSRGPGGVGVGGDAPNPDEGWVLDRATGTERLVVEAPVLGALRESPDEQHVAYLSYTDRINTVFVAELPAGEPMALPPPAREGYVTSQGDPAWSPDGSRLAYAATAETHYEPGVRTEEVESLNVVDWRTGVHEVLYEAAEGVSLDEVDWSASGEQILFTEHNLLGTALVIDVDTGKVRPVAEDVFIPVVAAAGDFSVLYEFGVPFELDETFGAQPVLVTRLTETVETDGVHSQALSQRFTYARELFIPDCALLPPAEGDPS